MIKERHVCALKYAKELKKLGYPQDDSLWYWIVDLQTQKEHLYGKVGREVYNHQIDYEIYAAPTVAELGEVLPDEIKWDNNKAFLTFDSRRCLSYKVVCLGNRTQYSGRSIWEETVVNKNADTEANTRAKMYIYLIKNKHIKVEDL